jgi:NAD(P)-dependent dehydrogenase (short-subunit alcohol dehydrogenase family)
MMTAPDLASPPVRRPWYRPSLTVQIFIGLILGGLLGWISPDWGNKVYFLRDIFLNLIKAIIAPLVFSTIVVGIAGAGSLKKVGRMGVKAIIYFEMATTAALFIGLAVVNFTSGSALTGMKYTSSYSAAKGAIVALSKVAANEWATQGIRVNVVCPFALTEIQKAMIGGDQDGYTLTAAMAPMGRGGDPETEVAPVIAFLVSDGSKFMTGTIVHVDGGLNELSPVDYSSMRGVLDDA